MLPIPLINKLTVAQKQLDIAQSLFTVLEDVLLYKRGGAYLLHCFFS